MSASSTRRARGGLGLALLIPAAAVALAHAPPAEAVLTTFTNRALWAAAAGATGPIQNEDFETLPTGALIVGSNQLGLINLRIELGTATSAGASINGAPAIGGNRDLSVNADEGMRRYDLSFGAPITAVGFDFAGAATGGIATLLADGQSLPFGAAGSGFFGIVSTTPLDSVGFGDTSPGALPTEIFDSDNYSFVAVPEPSTMLLVSMGIFAIGRRRRA